MFKRRREDYCGRNGFRWKCYRLTRGDSKRDTPGGVAGSVVTADAIGVLNNTLGVGQFIPFELMQMSVEGTEWKVTATEKYAAGACGLMLGEQLIL